VNKTKICAVPSCNYPVGECAGLCWHPDEARADVIGQNGPTGEHYHQTATFGSGDEIAMKMTEGTGQASETPRNESGGPDMVNHPPHYTRGFIECIDAIQSALSPEEYKGYLKGAVLKYLWRLDHKGSARENAEKAMWYLQRLINLL